MCCIFQILCMPQNFDRILNIGNFNFWMQNIFIFLQILWFGSVRQNITWKHSDFQDLLLNFLSVRVKWTFYLSLCLTSASDRYHFSLSTLIHNSIFLIQGDNEGWLQKSLYWPHLKTPFWKIGWNNHTPHHVISTISGIMFCTAQYAMSSDCYFMCHSLSLFQWWCIFITYYSILDGIGRVEE